MSFPQTFPKNFSPVKLYQNWISAAEILSIKVSFGKLELQNFHIAG